MTIAHFVLAVLSHTNQLSTKTNPVFLKSKQIEVPISSLWSKCPLASFSSSSNVTLKRGREELKDKGSIYESCVKAVCSTEIETKDHRELQKWQSETTVFQPKKSKIIYKKRHILSYKVKETVSRNFLRKWELVDQSRVERYPLEPPCRQQPSSSFSSLIRDTGAQLAPKCLGCWKTKWNCFLAVQVDFQEYMNINIICYDEMTNYIIIGTGAKGVQFGSLSSSSC